MSAAKVGFGPAVKVVAPPEAAEGSTSVRVLGNYQVGFEGAVFGPGEVAIVPEAVAAQWVACGWVEPA